MRDEVPEQTRSPDMTMSPELRERAIQRLRSLIHNPKARSIDGLPAVRAKSGRLYEVTPGTRGYGVAIDFGLTCRDLGEVPDVAGVLDLILAEEARRERSPEREERDP